MKKTLLTIALVSSLIFSGCAATSKTKAPENYVLSEVVCGQIAHNLRYNENIIGSHQVKAGFLNIDSLEREKLIVGASLYLSKNKIYWQDWDDYYSKNCSSIDLS
jgi:hypothetical protein